MPDKTTDDISGIERPTGEVTDPADISSILGELAACKELLFFSEIGADLCFLATAIALDSQRRTFRVSITTSPEDEGGICIGNQFDVFVPMLKEDLAFSTLVVGVGSTPDNTFDLAMPSQLHLGCRRKHLRGSCFGLVEVLLRRKDEAQSEAIRAALNDISTTGCGIYLPQGAQGRARAGDRFDDCVLLLNNKPMALCTIEVRHTRPEPETGSLLAGGCFTALNPIARHRIAQLIATLDPLWGP
jgi:hypothetical protein